MEKILDFIATETDGRSYKSFKFCHDTVAIPSVDYNDNADNKISVKQDAENSPPNKPKNLQQLAEKIKDNPPLFRFFLDGSRRTYKIDDIEYNKKIYPVVAGQIGVGCCERVDKSTFKKMKLERHLAISLPSQAYADGHRPELFFNRLRDKLNDRTLLKNQNLEFSKILHYNCSSQNQDEKYEDRAVATIQDEMIACEKSVVNSLVAENRLNSDNYLIKDGSLQYVQMRGVDDKELARFKNNYRCVIGVSKMFSPDLMTDKNNKSNATKIADLKLFERTPAFKYEHKERIGDVSFAIWYVRIREKQHTNTPFSGILKLEKILTTRTESDDGLSSEEIDLITANIINERNPVCYGSDDRWANHLYPVYLTEKYIKSQYISDIYFLNLF